MSALPRPAKDVAHSVLTGAQCAECSEPMRRPHGHPVACTGCWEMAQRQDRPMLLSTEGQVIQVVRCNPSWEYIERFREAARKKRKANDNG